MRENMSRFLSALLVAFLGLGQFVFSDETSSESVREFSRPQEPKRPYTIYQK